MNLDFDGLKSRTEREGRVTRTRAVRYELNRYESMLEKVDGGAKDMSVPKRKHFVELKHV